MKNFTKLSLIAIVALVFSCSSDDDNDTDYSVSKLVGEWLLISDVDEQGVEYVEEGSCDYKLVFTETTINGLEYYGVNCDMLDEESPLSFNLNGNKLSFTEEGELIEEEILELTSTTLKLRYDYVEDGESYYDITTFTKQ